jgi:hypothetical protein
VACLFLTSHPTSAQANFRFILISSTAAIYPGEIRRSDLGNVEVRLFEAGSQAIAGEFGKVRN